MERACIKCGGPIPEWKRSDAKYCGYLCRTLWDQEMMTDQTAVCRCCGEEFFLNRRGIRRAKQYCSKDCWSIGMSDRGTERYEADIAAGRGGHYLGQPSR